MNRLRKQILAYLSTSSKSIWDLFLELDCPERELVDELNALHAEKKIKVDDKIHLIDKGMYSSVPSVKLPLKEGRGISATAIDPSALEKFKSLTSGLDPDSEKLQQMRILPEEALLKTAFMDARGDIQGNDILLVGDDDFASIAIALYGGFKSITVLEIDESIIEAINKICKEENFEISVEKYDVRHEFPEKLKAKFDTVLTNPPDSLEGMQLFVSRGVEALKGKEGALYTDLTHLESTLSKWHMLEKKFLDMNFVITDIIRQFSHYPETENDMENYDDYPLAKQLNFQIPSPEKIWFTSSLLRLELVREGKPLFKGKVEFSDDFYRDKDTLTVQDEFR